ncbi:MAG: hypothetical protein FWE53_00630 [Firmicutes bacterium]|nr:hypothetical protein [Bacillota bacterium]
MADKKLETEIKKAFAFMDEGKIDEAKEILLNLWDDKEKENVKILWGLACTFTPGVGVKSFTDIIQSKSQSISAEEKELYDQLGTTKYSMIFASILIKDYERLEYFCANFNNNMKTPVKEFLDVTVTIGDKPFTYLAAATNNNDEIAVKILLKYGASPLTQHNNRPAVVTAIMSEKLGIAGLMMEVPGVEDFVLSYAVTTYPIRQGLMESAIYQCSGATAKFLLDYGADKKAALAYAKSNKHKNMFKFIRNLK